MIEIEKKYWNLFLLYLVWYEKGRWEI